MLTCSRMLVTIPLSKISILIYLTEGDTVVRFKDGLQWKAHKAAWLLREV